MSLDTASSPVVSLMFPHSRTFCYFLLKIVSIVLVVVVPGIAVGISPSAAGVWKTIDDKTHQARGTIRIYEQNGEFFGKILSSVDPEEAAARCEKCTGDLRNQPISGLVILRGLKRQGNEYTGGEITDPETGSTYHCQLKLSDDGSKLAVRGYLGFSLLGRTQIWLRQE